LVCTLHGVKQAFSLQHYKISCILYLRKALLSHGPEQRER